MIFSVPAVSFAWWSAGSWEQELCVQHPHVWMMGHERNGVHVIPMSMSYQCKEQSWGAILDSPGCIQDGANSVACLVLNRTCHATCLLRAEAENSQVWKKWKEKGSAGSPSLHIHTEDKTDIWGLVLYAKRISWMSTY